MQYRKAKSPDVPGITEVLKVSLGEADLLISPQIWNYKHVINPFGESIVLLAEQDGAIAGVRAFMKWEWQKGSKLYNTYRAVDTATHPNFQGRGIFKKLTLKAVNSGIEEKGHFIFNTPNSKSRPGYLKMGWEKVDNLKVGIRPAWNSFFKLKIKPIHYTKISEGSKASLQKLCENWNYRLEKRGKLFTPKSVEFLRWRYENNPLQEYEIISAPNYYIAGYVKKREKIRELRISECIYTQKKDIREIKIIINEWCSKFGVQIISYSPDLFPSQKITFNGHYGPILTLKNLNLSDKDFEENLEIFNWCYSLGDLELF